MLIKLLVLLSLSGFACHALGQDTKLELSRAQIESRIKKFKNNKQYQVKYDRFKDITSVTASRFTIGKNPSIFNVRFFYCSAGFEFDGEILKKVPKQFNLSIRVTSQRAQAFNLPPELILLIDGERYKPDRGDYQMQRTPSYGSIIGEGYDETIVYSIEASMFRKMALAKVIEIQLGALEFKFKSDVINMFRDMNELFTSDQSPPSGTKN